MSPLIVGIATAASLVIIPLVAENRKHALEDMKWFKQDGTQVTATVTAVQTKQAWKYGERLYRDSWDGTLKREKTWQTYYDVTAQWMNPQTKQVYTFYSNVWAVTIARRLVAGNPISVSINLGNPRQYNVDFQLYDFQASLSH